MRKHHAPQKEFGIANEAFALVSQSAIDGDKVTAERAQRERDRKEAAENQPDWFLQRIVG